MHLSGVDLPENLDRAETYLRGAAKRDHLPSIIGLAELYTRGNGIAPIFARPLSWYRRAAELGDVESQFIVGRRNMRPAPEFPPIYASQQNGFCRRPSRDTPQQRITLLRIM